MTLLGNLSLKEILNDFNENYNKIRKFLYEDSKNDPENEPYMSKYKAKQILLGMYVGLKELESDKATLESLGEIKLHAMLGVVLMNIGSIEMDTEELTASEKTLSEAVELLEPNASQPEIVITMLAVYNNLGILWSNRDEPEKAKSYLLKAKELYENFKCTLQMPILIEHLIGTTEDNFMGDVIQLEKAYTLTLYYLAQVYGSLKENLTSAVYCHITLRRQLEYKEYELIDWALNSATLSQCFAEQNGFLQSRHHLAAASIMLDQYEEKLMASESNDEVHLAKVETFRHRSADVARCWAKYCILLMSTSKDRLMDDKDEKNKILTDLSSFSLQDNENKYGVDITKLIFPDLDVSKYESQIGYKYLLTYQDAREVFLICQTWLSKAKEYYKLDTLASDYIELIQDSSQAYSYLAFFEEDDERRAKMHKRRIDMLEDTLKEVNPVYYLQYCRQLWYELGEVYTDILNIKLEKNKSVEKPTAQSLKKINMLCEKSIEYYQAFLDSVKDKQGNMPVKLTDDLIKPVISAYAFMGRNSMKRITLDKATQLCYVQKSFDAYQGAVDICTANENAAMMMREEFSLCQEMVNILPIKIKRLKHEIGE